MLIDKTKFDQILERELTTLSNLKEPELYWYTQTNLVRVLKEVEALISEDKKVMTPVAEKVEKSPEPKKKATKVKETPKVEEDGKDN